jgi:Flp pilus assembly protein TadG
MDLSLNKQTKISRLKRFLKSEAGNVSQMLALSALPLFASLGVAIDTVRLTREETAFHAAVDAAVLAVAADDRSAIGSQSASQQTASINTLKTFAQNFINANYVSSTGVASDITIDLAINNQEIVMTAHHAVPTALMGLFGVQSTMLNSSSTVKKAMRPVELTLVMDTTGSMASNNKISGAKTAAKSLLKTLYGGDLAQVPESEFLRVSLVPFAAAVRLDKTAYDYNLGWVDTTGANPLSSLNFNDSTWNNFSAWSQVKPGGNAGVWNGCVEARSVTGGLNQNDAAPAGGDTLFPAYFAFDTPPNSSGQTSRYGYDYLNNDTTGLTLAQANDFSDAGRLYVQKNQAKYVNKTISAESVSSTGPWSGCAASKIVPMTHNRGNLEAGIDAMQASGPTLIAEGLAWGWRTTSPTEPFTKVEGTGSIPAANLSVYDDVRWRKVMVLMTDGDNDLGAGSYGYNGTIYSSYGRGRESLTNNRFGTTSDSQIMTKLDDGMLAVCTGIKSKNIELYVTSFGTGVSAATKARLQSCATKPENYANSTTSTDLQAFFDHIGQDVLNKSVYVAK